MVYTPATSMRWMLGKWEISTIMIWSRYKAVKQLCIFRRRDDPIRQNVSNAIGIGFVKVAVNGTGIWKKINSGIIIVLLSNVSFPMQHRK